MPSPEKGQHDALRHAAVDVHQRQASVGEERALDRGVAALDGVEEFADVGEDPASTGQEPRLDGFLHDGSERCPPVARVEHCVRRELHEVPWPAVGLQFVEIAGRDRHTRDRVGKADVEARVIVLGRVLAIDQQAGPLLFRDVLPPAAVEAPVMLPVVRENAVQGRTCGSAVCVTKADRVSGTDDADVRVRDRDREQALVDPR